MEISIEEITWHQIYAIWRDFLWPNRNDPIEPNSALDILGNINMDFMDNPATFLGAFIDGKLVGVNSLHLAGTNSFRSRGLYVHPDYRGRGIARKLLLNTCDIARKANGLTIWSIPRHSSFRSYQSVGFVRCSNWLTEGFPNGPNCYAIAVL